MYSRSAKGGEKGDPNRNPWLAKMIYGRLGQSLVRIGSRGLMFSEEVFGLVP